MATGLNSVWSYTEPAPELHLKGVTYMLRWCNQLKNKVNVWSRSQKKITQRFFLKYLISFLYIKLQLMSFVLFFSFSFFPLRWEPKWYQTHQAVEDQGSLWGIPSPLLDSKFSIPTCEQSCANRSHFKQITNKIALRTKQKMFSHSLQKIHAFSYFRK